MERTLYLHEQPGLRVSRDGPSLWVEQRGTAGRRVPVRLVRRVLIAGNVALDAESLTAFAERGVPVTLLNREGQPVAMVVGCTAGLFSRRAEQAAALEDPRLRERLSAWLRAWERGRRLALASRVDPITAARWRQAGLRARDYDLWLARQAHVRGAPPRRRGFFQAALHTLVLERVSETGWDPHLGVLHRGPLSLVRDCVAAIQADADLVWLESGGLESVPSDGAMSQDLAAHLETHRPRLKALLRRLLDQYESIIRER